MKPPLRALVMLTVASWISPIAAVRLFYVDTGDPVRWLIIPNALLAIVSTVWAVIRAFQR